MKSNRLTRREYWDDHWKTFKPKIITEKNIQNIFPSLFKKYLPVNHKFRCLEVGCVPGDLLIALNKIFGYRPVGVDYNNKIDLIRKNMRKNGITDYKVYKADIFKFEPKEKYDVVCSFGLIEHFSDPKPCIGKMASLVRKGGYYIVHVPNFRWLQYIIHYFSDKELFDTHNLKYMDIDNLEKVIHEVASVETIYAGYFGIIQDWPKTGFLPMDIIHYLTHGFNIIADKLGLNTLLANRYTSTDTVFIGRKL